MTGTGPRDAAEVRDGTGSLRADVRAAGLCVRAEVVSDDARLVAAPPALKAAAARKGDGPVVGYRGQRLINFRWFSAEGFAHGYRWVDIKCFRLPAALCANGEGLSALIGAAEFADGYAGGGIDPTGTTHGPYRIGHITAAAYDPVQAPEAISVIENWARQYGDPPDLLAGALEEHVYRPIRKAAGCYRLKDLGTGVYHDWGGVQVEFYEFAVIDRVTGTVSLIVAADD